MSNLPLLNISSHDQKLISEAFSRILPEFDCYLFGSRANGSHGERSDIDLLAIHPAGVAPTSDQRYLIERELELADVPVDLLFWHSMPSHFKKNIVEHKYLLLCSSSFKELLTIIEPYQENQSHNLVAKIDSIATFWVKLTLLMGYNNQTINNVIKETAFYKVIKDFLTFTQNKEVDTKIELIDKSTNSFIDTLKAQPLFGSTDPQTIYQES